MKFREQQTTINFPIFGYRVKLAVTNDVPTSIARRISGFDAAHTAAMVLVSDNLAVLMIIPIDANEALVAHESWHAIHKMLEVMQADLDNETVAYHLGYLVAKVHAFLRKCHASKK